MTMTLMKPYSTPPRWFAASGVMFCSGYYNADSAKSGEKLTGHGVSSTLRFHVQCGSTSSRVSIRPRCGSIQPRYGFHVRPQCGSTSGSTSSAVPRPVPRPVAVPRTPFPSPTVPRPARPTSGAVPRPVRFHVQCGSTSSSENRSTEVTPVGAMLADPDQNIATRRAATNTDPDIATRHALGGHERRTPAWSRRGHERRTSAWSRCGHERRTSAWSRCGHVRSVRQA